VKRRATLLALSLPPYIWLGLFITVPLILMFALSFRADMQGELFSFWTPTLKQYQTIFAIDYYWQRLSFSIAMAFGVAVLAVALAYPVAYFLVFCAGRAAGLCLVLLLIPFWSSFLLRVMSWKFLLGSDGPVNWLLIHLGVIAEPMGGLLYTRSALVITLIYVWIPFAALPVAAALKGIEPELVEAALDLGASPWRCFRTITFPLSLPGVLAAFFMVFIPTVGEYVTPLLVGGPNSYMYGNIIQDFFTQAANLPRGAALSVVMLVVTLLLVALASPLVNLKAVRMTQRQAAVSSRARFPLLTGYFAGLIALLYLPLAVLFLLSFDPGTGLSFPFQGLTFQWYEQLFQHPETLSSARNSIIVAAVSSCGATALGTALALLHMRFHFRGEKLLFALAMLPLVVPAIILAVALLVMFLAAGVDRSLWTVAIAHTVVALPYVILIVSARLAGFDPDLEEAAMDLGAPYGRVIFNIVLPLIAPSILSAWLVAFTISLDEVALAQFLAGADRTFPVYLLAQLRFANLNRLPMMIAFAVVMMTGTLLLVLIAEWIRRRGQPGTVR
jgi:ABC-type spermidine/putrescine transport system permease subunit II